jgi:hypothetical protein
MHKPLLKLKKKEFPKKRKDGFNKHKSKLLKEDFLNPHEKK